MGIKIGIGSVKIGHGSGDSWSAYWKTLNNANIVMEGHSFMAEWSAMDQILQYSINKSGYYIGATNGAFVSDCVARSVVVDSKLVQETSSIKNILLLWIGVNEVTNTIGTGTTAYNALKSYVQSRILAGWKVFVFTMTPATASGRGAGFESERVIFNGLIRSDLSLLSKVYILDTDTITELGDPSSIIYYVDAIHPRPNGAYLANELFLNKLISLGATGSIVPNETPATFTLTQTGDGTGVSTLELITSESVVLTLDGSAKFYSTSAGTTGEVNRKVILKNNVYNAMPVGGYANILYIKCPSGTANLIINKNKITTWQNWTSAVNAAKLGGSSLGSLTALQSVTINGNNNLTGSISALTLCEVLNVGDVNTLSGSIEPLTLLKNYGTGGSNTITGSASLCVFLEKLSIWNTNTVTIPNATNLKGLSYLYVYTNITLSSANVNQLLADFWLNRDEVKPLTNRTINIAGNAASGAPTGQGITDKAALQAYRSPNMEGDKALWTVTTR